MKKILVFSPSTVDACAFYRGIGAFAPLRHANYLIEACPAKVEWSAIMGGDILYMQRPFNESHLKLAAIAKRQMPLWVDYDDALFHLTFDNPVYEQYAKSTVRTHIKEIVELADVISFATPKLAELFAEHCSLPPHVIIPNAYNDYLHPTTLPTEPRTQRVLWRGSYSHQGDLAAYANPLAQCIDEHPDWDFLFMGMAPWMLPAGTRISFHGGQDIMHYFPTIRDKIKAAIHIVPLSDSDFNKGKSNISWLEATHAGSATLGPDWEEWQRPGLATYIDQDDLYRNLKLLLQQDSESLRYNAEKSWKYIQENLFLSQINKLRIDLIEELT